MAKKPEEPKLELEREYIIPLRRQWLKVPEYKRVNKAVKAIKQFLAKHMKVYDRDLKKIKMNILLNNELRFRGMRKPPAKIKIKAKKYDTGIVEVELAEIPKVLQYKLDKEAKQEAKKRLDEKRETAAKAKAAAEAKEAAESEKKAEEKEGGVEKEKAKEEKQEANKEAGLKKAKEEKQEANKEAGLKKAKDAVKQAKHTVQKTKGPKHQIRKALAK